MGDHDEEHPGAIQYKPAKEDENKIQDEVVIMKPRFCFLPYHKVLHWSFLLRTQ